MADYRRLPQTFDRPGQTTRPRDKVKPGRQQLIENLRQYTLGTLQVRNGLRRLTNPAPSASDIHTIARLNDSTPGAVNTAIRVASAASSLYASAVADPHVFGAAVDTGYASGEPLSYTAAVPIQSPRAFLYLANRLRQRKLNTDLTVLPIGLAPPAGPPSTVVVRPGVTLLKDITSASVGDWSAVGADTSAPTGTANDVNTTVSQIAYDSGTTGWATVVPTSHAGIVEGMLIKIGGEQVQVHSLTVAVSDTTIAQIIYDSGTTGACQIQPTASLGTGQLEDVPLAAYRLRNPEGRYGHGVAVPRGEVGTPPQTDLLAPLSPRIRQVDFPVNCLIRLSGTEYTLIRSINVGSDGVQSFRAITAGTHSATGAIAGYRGFRCHLNSTVSAGATIQRDKISVSLSSPTASEKVTGGAKCSPTVNAALINGRATQQDDILHVHVKINEMTRVKAVRLYLDVDATTNDFLQNYYVFEWRGSDLISAIQATNGGDTGLFIEAFKEATINRQTRHRTDQPVIGTAIPRPGYTPPPTRRRDLNASGTTDQAATTELALGNNQWIDLQCRIHDLIRVGTDGSRTLADVKAVEVLVTAATSDATTLTLDLADAYLTGGYGPDIGQIGNPYVYRYRYRSSLTGETSGLSPTSRGGAIARRQGITVTGTSSGDPHGDLLDWFRQGGTVDRFVYTGTSTATSLTDGNTDSAITDGLEPPDPPDFQPWPIIDAKKTGVCTAAGGALRRTAGASFDTNWARGTEVIVNGFSATIDQVISTDVLLLMENVGSGTGLTFTVPTPELLAQSLQALWGSDEPGVLFACGDQYNPGTLYWTKDNNPDVTADRNQTTVTHPSEPLMHGFCWDGRHYVFSTRNLYELVKTRGADGLPTYEARLTPCGKGLWSHYAYALAPEGIYFLSTDGIYLTAGGSAAVSITDDDLYDLFPHDGLPGESEGSALDPNIEAPDMTQTHRLRLAWIDGLLYFDYLGIAAHERTLIFDTNPEGGGWIQDVYTTDGAVCRIGEQGSGIHNQVVACGVNLAIYEGTQDFGSAVAWRWQSADIDGGDPRLVKQWGDAVLDMGPSSTVITVVPKFDHGEVTLASQTRTGSVRKPYILDINDGAGQLARSISLTVSGPSSASPPPQLFGWEPACLLKSEEITRRATDWEDLGTPGAKFIQGLLLRANTYNTQKTFLVQGDGTTRLTLNVTHNGELTVAYPIASTGWTPFIAHLVRLWPSGDDDLWQLYAHQWVWEPAPELATEWTTQSTTHDLPGYLHVRDAFMAYSDATAAITFEILYDNVSYSTTISPASTAYTREYVILPAAKGRSVSYRWRSNAPFRLYRKDVSVRVQGWGMPGGYQVMMPFGGESRAVGAQI